MKCESSGLYVMAFVFTGLAMWRFVSGVETSMQLAGVAVMQAGAVVTGFLITAANMRIKHGEWEVTIARMAESTIGIGGRVKDEILDVTESARAESATTQSFVSVFSKLAPGSSDDPNHGRFGGSRYLNGLTVDAFITPHPDKEQKDKLAVVKLRVRDEKKAGSVRFFLHPTFRQQTVDVQATDGVAELVIVAWGGFTVGVTTSDGRVAEIDLAQCPGGPSAFYAS